MHMIAMPPRNDNAPEIAELSQLSFWDGLIVASAEQVGAKIIYTEDLNTDQLIAGMRIVNPLR